MIPSVPDLWLTFLTALLASGHCIGMCGGMVVAYSLKLPQQTGYRTHTIISHLLYSIGRILTYVTLGALSGWIGSLSLTFGRPLSLQGIPHLLMGMIMTWMGLNSAGILPSRRGNRNETEQDILSLALQKILRKTEKGRTFMLGIVTGLLPCSLHWAFQAKAVATGSTLGGMAVLMAFGLGTLPTLWGMGWASTWLSTRAREKLLHGASLLIVLMGLLIMWHGLKITWEAIGR